MSDSDQELLREIERLRAENEELRQRREKPVRLQVSEKGAVSLYGIRRFPVTFYQEEWERILGLGDEIRAFIRQNAARLKKRGAGA